MRILICTALAALSPLALAANTLKVPDAANGIATLQQALDLAQTGDRIVVAGGEYRGNFATAGKQNLTIEGAGAEGTVVLDGRANGDLSSGPALTFNGCDDLRLVNLVCRHARGAGNLGIGIRLVDCDHARFDRVAVLDSAGAGIDVQGDLATFDQCRAEGNSGGITVAGFGTTITKTTVTNDRGGGISVFGDSTTIRKCKVAVIRVGSAIQLTGEHPTVEQCELSGAVDSNGLSSTGSFPLIRKNDVHDCAVGIDVVYGAFGKVEDNDVRDCTGVGFRTGGASHELKIRDNLVERCGMGDEAGFLILGEQHQLTSNVARGCAGDGFNVQGNAATLTSNRAESNLKDGFDVDPASTGSTLQQNEATGNHGEGFENSGTLTNYLSNVAKKNRIQFASDGTLGTFTGNQFGNAGPQTPEID